MENAICEKVNKMKKTAIFSNSLLLLFYYAKSLSVLNLATR